LNNKGSSRTFSAQPKEEDAVMKLEIPEHVNKLADQILGLPAIDMGLLFEAIRRKAGLPADFEKSLNFSAGPAGPAPAAAQEAAPPPAEEKPAEKTSFQVKLISFDEAAKFKVLKEIRALKPGMQLMEVRSNIEYSRTSATRRLLCSITMCLIMLFSSSLFYHLLLQSKALIEKLPSILKDDVSKDEGAQWVEKLKAAGAVVELA